MRPFAFSCGKSLFFSVLSIKAGNTCLKKSGVLEPERGKIIQRCQWQPESCRSLRCLGITVSPKNIIICKFFFFLKDLPLCFNLISSPNLFSITFYSVIICFFFFGLSCCTQLSLVAATGATFWLWYEGFSLWWLLVLWLTGSRVLSSCPKSWGIFLDQGLNPCALHWQADS